MNYHIVTSFGEKGFTEYGKRFLQTFQQFWPEEVKLHVYHEGQDLSAYTCIHAQHNIRHIRSCKDFLRRHAANYRAHGKEYRSGDKWKQANIDAGYSFRYDAFKFCRKVFALDHAMQALHGEGGSLFWLDADTVTFDSVPVTLLDRMLPKKYTLSHLDRPGYHSECGFVGYNLDQETAFTFIREFALLYEQDRVFTLSEWHDSWVFDWLRRKLQISAYGIPHKIGNHVFISSELGFYMDHVKGDRKIDGRSYPPGDPKAPNQHPYWTGKPYGTNYTPEGK